MFRVKAAPAAKPNVVRQSERFCREEMNYSNPVAKYITEIQNVREVRIVGSADIEYWCDHLARERLSPYKKNGQAELLINAVEMKWMGINFREIVISIPVCDGEDGNSMDGYYLVQAYNSSALLALSERAFFHTPYTHNDIEISAQVPASIRQGKGLESFFRAQMSGKGSCSGQRDEIIEGKIFIQNNKYFYAKISGAMEVCPFLVEEDTFVIETEKSHDALQWLIESNFTGQEWHIRRDGTHARSKTYQRT